MVKKNRLGACIYSSFDECLFSISTFDRRGQAMEYILDIALWICFTVLGVMGCLVYQHFIKGNNSEPVVFDNIVIFTGIESEVIVNYNKMFVENRDRKVLELSTSSYNKPSKLILVVRYENIRS